MLRKVVSRLDVCKIIFSLWLCVVCVTGPDTSICSKTIVEFEGGTRLAMPKTGLRAGYLVIEARFRGY